MMKIQIKDFVGQLFNKDSKNIKIPDEIVRFLQNKGLSELEALEESENLLKRIKRAVYKKIRDCKNQAIIPKYVFDKSNDDFLIRIDLSVEPHKEDDARRVILWKDQISEIIKNISWQEFEKVCKLILEINNVSDCKVTRGTKEGGIDVYGWLKHNDINSKRIFHDVNFRIISQAKHRGNGGEVSNNYVSEFVTDIEKLRRKEGLSLFVLPQKFINSPLPLIPIFITNGYYGIDARITAKNHGIILWNGEQISEDIAKYFDLSVFITDDKIDRDKVRNYLNSIVN